ncbi:MAG: DUF2179 domain-containing protein [candidate division FCPU426 bacterium]
MPILSEWAQSSVFQWVLLPLLIFCARVVDVTLGTIRIIFITRGQRYWAPLIGFVEVLIWLLAITQLMRNLNNLATYFAFAGGFATGTFAGMWLENRLAMGLSIIRIITPQPTPDLLANLRESGFGVTTIDGQGLFRPVKVLFSIVKRKRIREILEIVKCHDPQAVYTVEDIRTVSPSAFPFLHPETNRLDDALGRFSRQGK